MKSTRIETRRVNVDMRKEGPSSIGTKSFEQLVNLSSLFTGIYNEFCFPDTLNVPRSDAEGYIEVEGKQNSPFPEGPVIKCFVIPSNSKIGKKTAIK